MWNCQPQLIGSPSRWTALHLITLPPDNLHPTHLPSRSLHSAVFDTFERPVFTLFSVRSKARVPKCDDHRVMFTHIGGSNVTDCLESPSPYHSGDLGLGPPIPGNQHRENIAFPFYIWLDQKVRQPNLDIPSMFLQCSLPGIGDPSK